MTNIVIRYSCCRHMMPYTHKSSYVTLLIVVFYCDILLLFIALADYAPYFYDNEPNSSNGNMALLKLSEDTPKGIVTFLYHLIIFISPFDVTLARCKQY